ncbi:hypothetical protein ACFLSJ_04690 [Verrucomicrobiota bacterium]
MGTGLSSNADFQAAGFLDRPLVLVEGVTGIGSLLTPRSGILRSMTYRGRFTGKSWEEIRRNLPRTPYRKLSHAQWAEVRAHLDLEALAEKRKEHRTRPYDSARPVFNTLLKVLWTRCPMQKRSPPGRGKLVSHGRGYCRGNRLVAALRIWVVGDPTGSAPLARAWGAYLRKIRKAEFDAWCHTFDFYQLSRHDWKEALRQSAKVHSPWFPIMADMLMREKKRRAKTRKKT